MYFSTLLTGVAGGVKKSTDTLEDTLAETVGRRGASGYTIIQARGVGSSGEVSGELDVIPV